MEWTEVHDLILVKEVRVSESWIYKPQTVDRGEVCMGIANCLNNVSSDKFTLKKKSIQKIQGKA